MTPRALTREAFAPFGSVVSVDGAKSRPANDGRAERFFSLAELQNFSPATRPELSVYRVAASTLPFEVTYLERHLHSSQLFVPTGGGAALIVVAPSLSDGRPNELLLVAFIAAPEQGIVYAPGTWHYPIVALERPADFLMFMWECDGAEDCEVQQLGTSIRIEGASKTHGR